MECLSADSKGRRFYSWGGLDFFLSNARGKTIKDISLFFYYNNLLFLSWFTSAASMPKINDRS